MSISRLALVSSLAIAAVACSSNRNLANQDAAGGGSGSGSGGAGGRTGGSGGAGGQTGGGSGAAGGRTGGGGAGGSGDAGGGQGGGGIVASGGAGGQLAVDAGMDLAPSDGAADSQSDAPADSGGDGVPGDAGPPLAIPAAFETRGTLTFKPKSPAVGPNLPLPTTQDLLLYVDPVAGSLILASPGQASNVPVTTTDRIHFTTTTMLYFQVPSSLCQVSLSYSSFSFTVQGGQVTGTASGTALAVQTDEAFSYEAQLTFTGTLDTHGPNLALPTQGVDPLAPPSVTPNEPLPATATAVLTSDADRIALEAHPGMSQVVTSFAVPAHRALRYGASYQLTITPWQDLAGNAGAMIGAFTTAAPPPLVAEDGFEGAATMVGGAQIIDASVLPPITGMRSAVLISSFSSGIVGGTRHLGVRLAVQSGDTVVRFNLRPWGSFQGTQGAANLIMTIAVPGGASITKVTSGVVSLTTLVTTGSNSVWMGDVMPIEVALPSGASSEIVVDLSTSASQSNCGAQPTNASYLIDDLRVD